MTNKSGKLQIIKYAPPPPDLPIYGQVDPAKCSFIGRTNYVAALEEKKFIFGIKRVDRRRHLYVVGKSGVGKSKLLELLMRQDVAYGYGFCLMDPSGDAINAILDFIPKERVKDVVLIDPFDVERPVAFNPLADVEPRYRHQLAQGIVESVEKQFGKSWTPRVEHILRFALLALFEYPGATMTALVPFVTDAAYRADILVHVQDELIKKFWTVDFVEWSKKYEYDTESIIPLVNKLSQFFSDPQLKKMLSSRENRIKLDECMRDKKIVLVNLSRSTLGEAGSSFLGSLFLAKLKEAGMRRAAFAEKERGDFYVYIDEFNGFITETFLSLLSEARKYSMCLTLSHQFMDQLLSGVQSLVLGNIGSIITFRLGGEDAARFKSEMAPVFEPKDMINLGIQEFYVKMTIDGETYDPFSAETLAVLPPSHPSLRKEIADASRTAYAAES